jgi:glycerophosphoryl diester phosphodiesterase
LLGICSNVTPILSAPTLINAIKSAGLLLATFGRENNEIENVVLQKKYGVDAIISDYMASGESQKKLDVFRKMSDENL